MDTEEVHRWIMPHDYDHTEAEAKHLVIFSNSFNFDLYIKIFSLIKRLSIKSKIKLGASVNRSHMTRNIQSERFISA